MKSLRSSAMAALLVLLSLGSIAADAQNPADMANGEVRKVDKDASKITIRHGEIRNLEMPPMTMVFTVAAPGLLDKVKAGDKIKFYAIQQDGKMVVTHILAAP